MALQCMQADRQRRPSRMNKMGNRRVAPAHAENAAISVHKTHSPAHADILCHPTYNANGCAS